MQIREAFSEAMLKPVSEETETAVGMDREEISQRNSDSEVN